MNSKGVGSDIISSRTQKLSTTSHGDVVTLLRRALRNDDGTDKDLLAEFPSFNKFARNGLNLAVEFRCGKQLSKAEATACFGMTKAHMEEEYDLSGYGWDDDDKWAEITSKESRLLLLFDPAAPERQPIGFVNFRLTLQGECWNAMEGAPCLYMYDIQLLEAYRRKGVGKQLLLTLEMMAKKARMRRVPPDSNPPRGPRRPRRRIGRRRASSRARSLMRARRSRLGLLAATSALCSRRATRAARPFSVASRGGRMARRA